MKCWSYTVIIAYLSVLLFGIVSHMFRAAEASHPGMYFIVWDMFCGWSTWETRLHILGEGESGTYYQLSPGPWGDYQPYSDVSRHHYDNFVNHAARIAVNCLRHTDHEPIRRIHVLEEAWNKKFNLPASLARWLCPSPGRKQSYVVLRDTYAVDGFVIQKRIAWHAVQAARYVSGNERLRRQISLAEEPWMLARRHAP